MGRMTRAALILLLSATPALAQVESREGIALQNQILELRQEVQQLQSNGPAPAPSAPMPQAEGVPAPAGDVAAQLVVRVSALEEQVRDLQGKVDDLQNQLQRQNDTL